MMTMNKESIQCHKFNIKVLRKKLYEFKQSIVTINNIDVLLMSRNVSNLATTYMYLGYMICTVECTYAHIYKHINMYTHKRTHINSCKILLYVHLRP